MLEAPEDFKKERAQSKANVEAANTANKAAAEADAKAGDEVADAKPNSDALPKKEDA